jgi:hypothetical protein
MSIRQKHVYGQLEGSISDPCLNPKHFFPWRSIWN